ncbi:MAG: hypothetical protein ACREN5_06015, partial [Gemmatimonadales bacterium]
MRRVRRVGSGTLDLRSGGLRQGGVGRQLAVVAAQGDDAFAQVRVGREDAMVAVAVDAGWRDEAAERGEK